VHVSTLGGTVHVPPGRVTPRLCGLVGVG
jgi:hypothetical protein